MYIQLSKHNYILKRLIIARFYKIYIFRYYKIFFKVS